jgi:hypothetical protein
MIMLVVITFFIFTMVLVSGKHEVFVVKVSYCGGMQSDTIRVQSESKPSNSDVDLSGAVPVYHCLGCLGENRGTYLNVCGLEVIENERGKK